MPPYVGMARKQNGGYNASISVQTPIFHLVVNSTRLQTVRSPRWSVADPGGGIGGQFPPSRSKIIKIHGIIIGSHTCNATFDTTSGLALQKLSLACT